MLCPSWTRRSNSASSCFLSQKSEPPATLVVNGLLAAARLFIVYSSITPNMLHETYYTTSLTTTVTRANCRIASSIFYSIASRINLLERGSFMTSAGAPEFGMFDQTLMLVSVASEQVPEGKGILRIFITSMKDSSQQDIVDISLTPPPRTVKDGMEQSDRFTYRTAARENPEEARCLLMEQQLSLRDVLGVLRRRAWIVLVVVFVAVVLALSLIHISEPTRLGMISYAVFCLKKKKKTTTQTLAP